MMTSITLVSALFVGVVGVRLIDSGNTEIEFDSSYTSILKYRSPVATEVVAIAAPEMSFEEIKVSAPVKVVVAVAKPVIRKVVPVVVTANELPFHEPVKLQRIEFKGELMSNMVALYDALPVEEKVLVAETVKEEKVIDEVKTAQASTEEIEPEFFEYEKKEEAPVAPEMPVEVAATAPAVEEAPAENINVNISDISTPVAGPAPESPDANLIAFDYSALKQDLKENKVPTVSAVTTHRKVKKNNPVVPPTPAQNEKANALLSPVYDARMTIQGVATDLKGNEVIQGFEIRFQDNTSETFEDYGDGEVTITLPMAQQRMSRSMVMLKRGFAPTNTDLILVEGTSGASIPVLPQDVVDTLLQPFANKGPIGLLLVELDDDTEKATLDLPFEQVITLDGDLNETSSEDFRYQLFVGVKPGNGLLTYVSGHKFTNKFVHIHERELTFESNEFDKENMDVISLYQEDLLSREKSPLITASENVRVFASNEHGEKLNQHTYKIDFGRALLGGRNYLELGHEREPIFVGARNEKDLLVPSESFMRHILSSLPEKNIGNRCVIQVNTGRPLADVQIAAESLDQNLMATMQLLDDDGKFYDSVSEKSRKIIIVGESQGSDENMGGKINVKITYQDGAEEYLGTYCSSNTYLVEQL